jgi:hypothetical protein
MPSRRESNARQHDANVRGCAQISTPYALTKIPADAGRIREMLGRAARLLAMMAPREYSALRRQTQLPEDAAAGPGGGAGTDTSTSLLVGGSLDQRFKNFNRANGIAANTSNAMTG